MPYSKEIGNKDFYDYYKKVSIKKSKPYVDYKTYSNILKDFNISLRDVILYKAEKVDLPYKLGTLYVKKFTRSYNEHNKRLWAIDFKATKEKGYTVYHGTMNGYYWKWRKVKARVKNQKYYSFRACRAANRLIAQAINKMNLDYCE